MRTCRVRRIWLLTFTGRFGREVHEVTELCRIGLTVQTHPNYQYRPCWSVGEYKHDVLLARLCFRKSVDIKPILQRSVIWKMFGSKSGRYFVARGSGAQAANSAVSVAQLFSSARFEVPARKTATPAKRLHRYRALQDRLHLCTLSSIQPSQ